MADLTISPNMGLSVPAVGIDPGPDWANNINASLSVIDAHDHGPNSGVQITPDGLNINADLAFNDNNATLLRSVRFDPQSAVLSGPADLGCLYEVGPDLYFNDGNGNQVKITSGGMVNSTSSGISSGTATAQFVAGVLVVDANVNTPANIQAGSILLGNNVANSKFLTLSPPAAMPANYQITLPTLPAASSFMVIDSSGNITDTISTAPVVNNYITNHWQLNGPYANLTYPLNEVDGFCFFNFNATIIAVWIYNVTPGSGGITQFDLKVASPGGSFSSILSTLGSIDSTAAANTWTDSNSVVGPQTGVVKPVLMSANVSAGQALRWDLIQAQTDPVQDCGVIIQFVGR